MEIEITDKKTNPILNRTEVHFIVNHKNQGTPNKAILRNELATVLNAKKDHIIIDTIHSTFGIQQIKGYAKVYSSRKEVEKIERKHILKRNQVSAEKPKKKEEETKETTKKQEEPEKKEEPPTKPEEVEEKKEETPAKVDETEEKKGEA